MITHKHLKNLIAPAKENENNAPNIEKTDIIKITTIKTINTFIKIWCQLSLWLYNPKIHIVAKINCVAKLIKAENMFETLNVKNAFNILKIELVQNRQLTA